MNRVALLDPKLEPDLELQKQAHRGFPLKPSVRREPVNSHLRGDPVRFDSGSAFPRTCPWWSGSKAGPSDETANEARGANPLADEPNQDQHFCRGNPPKTTTFGWQIRLDPGKFWCRRGKPVADWAGDGKSQILICKIHRSGVNME